MATPERLPGCGKYERPGRPAAQTSPAGEALRGCHLGPPKSTKIGPNFLKMPNNWLMNKTLPIEMFFGIFCVLLIDSIARWAYRRLSIFPSSLCFSFTLFLEWLF